MVGPKIRRLVIADMSTIIKFEEALFLLYAMLSICPLGEAFKMQIYRVQPDLHFSPTILAAGYINFLEKRGSTTGSALASRFPG